MLNKLPGLEMHLSSLYLPFFLRLCLIQECGLNNHSGKLGCITLCMPRRFSPPSSPPNHQEKIPSPHSNSEQVPVLVHVLNLRFFFLFCLCGTSLFYMRLLISSLLLSGLLLVSLLLVVANTRNKTDVIFRFLL